MDQFTTSISVYQNGICLTTRRPLQSKVNLLIFGIMTDRKLIEMHLNHFYNLIKFRLEQKRSNILFTYFWIRGNVLFDSSELLLNRSYKRFYVISVRYLVLMKRLIHWNSSNFDWVLESVFLEVVRLEFKESAAISIDSPNVWESTNIFKNIQPTVRHLT